MMLLEYTNFDEAAVADNFGGSEYSYWFVKRAFRHVLERVGRRIEISDPAREIPAIAHDADMRGERCLFLPFCPPNTMPLGMPCPTIPLFAWEYYRIPDEAWNNDPREDWSWVLGQTDGAITHCQSAAASVRQSMGPAFPVWVIPAPLFDKYAGTSTKPRGWHAPFDLVPEGSLTLSAGDVDLSPFRPDRPPAEGIRALRALERELAGGRGTTPRLRLEGVIYTAVLNPFDGRKNWHDMTTGFVWAFRHTATATLVLKLTRFDLEDGLLPVLRHLSTLAPFACRIVLIQGLLSEPAYRALIDATSYAVNTSYGEGQCLPLMEYMSAGRPALAPAHTAMLDYVSPENSFVIDSEPCATHWPHDERLAQRCLHFRISTADFARKCRESYHVARDEADRYARMSEAAVTALQAFCSDEIVTARLSEVLARFDTRAENRVALT